MATRFRTRLTPLFLVWLLVAGHAAVQAPSTPARFAAVERVAAESRRTLGSPGLSVAVVLDDTLAWSAGFGLADVENDVPARGDSVYRIASISKTMAATAVMQLVERGQVALDDPIQKYVPAFPTKGKQTITVRHVLSHTSGIRHYKAGEMDHREPYDSIDAAIAIFKDDPLLFTPGEKYSYSSYAFNLLAGLVERASGIGYEAYLTEHIWKPAGMTHTYLEHPQEVVSHRVRQYVKAGGNPRVRNAPYADLSIKWAGGGAISTVEDLARFHIALDQGKLLKPDTMERMYTPTRLNDGSQSDYGLGWMINRDADGHRWIAHSGGATGGSTYLLRDPARKLAVVVFSNVQDAGNLRDVAMRIAEAAQAPAGTRSRE